MRLESFCRFAMRYLEASWHRPYDHVGEDGEAIGFGHGDGSVSGEIEGTFVWANYPRRRQDGVWTRNLRGKVALDEGARYSSRSTARASRRRDRRPAARSSRVPS